MSAKESKAPEYIKFPYDVFLMLRLEFLALCHDELEAKIMRIIEKAVNAEWERVYMERCGRTPKNQEVEMPEEIWVPIPMRYFMDRLLGTVQSETTLKDALNKSLIQTKKLVFRKDRAGKYEAPLYALNRDAILKFFATLPSDPRMLDILSLMKQPRKKKAVSGDQLLTPSNNDPMETDGTNSRYHQLLTPSTPIIDPMTERGGDQLLAPTNMYTNMNSLDDKRENIVSATQNNALSISLSNETDNHSQSTLFPKETTIPIADDNEKPTPKVRKPKKVLDLVPTPPPAKPLEDTPWSVEKCLAWGDYARKCVFPVSNHPQSKYYKSVEAAKKIIGQGITENTFLAVYLNWMKGVNTNLEALPESATRSETWGNYSVDLWVFIEHYEDEARKYRAKKSGQSFQVSSTTPIDFTAQKEAARIKNLANIAKMEQIKAKIELEKQQAGKKKVAL